MDIPDTKVQTLETVDKMDIPDTKVQNLIHFVYCF
jgi:hypothetical protein